MPVRVVRIGRITHDIWSGAGAARVGGRWNAPGVEVIYAASTKSLSMLETLVQGGDFSVPRAAIEAQIPADVAIETLTPLPAGWRELDSSGARDAGTAWVASGRTAVLRVPSAVVPDEMNFLINPRHPDAVRITVGAPAPVEWDPRLFGIAAPPRRV